MNKSKLLEMQENFDWAVKKTLEQLQRIITHCVNTRDTARLIIIQKCTQELYRTASEALDSNKFIEIEQDKELMQ